MAVDVTATAPGGEFKAGTPRELFVGLRGLGGHNFDVSPDGRRFIVNSEGLERVRLRPSRRRAQLDVWAHSIDCCTRRCYRRRPFE